MKKILYIAALFLFLNPAFGQDEQPGAARLKEKMVEYIGTRLGLTKAEAERFEPLFTDYLDQQRQIKKDHKGDRLLLQQKVIELRLKFRDRVRPVIGEKGSNDVFNYEREFIQKIQDIQKERMQERREGRANKRKNSEL